ncbi:LysR substrate-binding domain-containing protein [Erwinia sp. B116]|uniref:LysR substrate-binding domain-containing protein n=1 Tax=Erwinia sp. B116 TaxID=1561024 RepID=UPI000C7740F4|nr:LysR substrate-binding domain-containing protein [Erwinia sp. B116]
MRYLPKMQQLRVFEEVVRQGSIRSAARTLAQSQPAISRALKELENTLQTALFLRGPGGITLTPSGQLFAVRNRFILQELQRAGDEIYSAQHPQQGKVAVGVCSLVGSTMLAEVVEKFRLRHPQARLTVKEGLMRSLLPLLNSGEIDFAAGPVPADLKQERLVITPLFQVPLCVVASKNHPARRVRALTQLSEQKWLLAEDESATLSSLNDELKRFFQALPQPALRTSSLLSAIELVERAGYLMLLPEPVVSRWSHSLVQLPIGTLPALRYGAVCSSHSPLTASAQQLLKILEKASGRDAWRCSTGKNSTPSLFPLC